MGLAVDHVGRGLYWSDLQGLRIMRADLDTDQLEPKTVLDNLPEDVWFVAVHPYMRYGGIPCLVRFNCHMGATRLVYNTSTGSEVQNI